MWLLYGRAGRLTAQIGGYRRGQFLGDSGACLPSAKQDGVFAEAIKLLRLEGATHRCAEMPGSYPASECRGDYTGGDGGGKFQISECLASGFGECAASCGGASRWW